MQQNCEVDIFRITPKDMQSSQISHIWNKEFSLKTFKEPKYVANKDIHAKMQPTQGWKQYMYAWSEYLLPR